MKSLISIIVLFLFFLSAYTQGSEELISQAQTRIDVLQKTFSADIVPVKMDKGVKNLLNQFISKSTDSIQQVIQSEIDSPENERLMALNSHAYFLDI